MSALTQAEREALLRRVEYRRGSGSYPWSATVDGLAVAGPAQRVDHPFLGSTVIMGARYWRTKREAVAAVRAAILELEAGREVRA